MNDFRGVFPILPTPFLPDESIDIGSFEHMIERMVGLRVDGVTILGVLGEQIDCLVDQVGKWHSLSDAEVNQAPRRAVSLC